MPTKTNIEWTDYTSNPISARRKGASFAHYKPGWFCDKPDKDGGCPHCYAEAINLRWGNGLRFDKANRDLVEFRVKQNELDGLRKLNRLHPGSMVFVADMFDLWQPSIPTEIVKQLFNTFDDCQNLTLQFLTKYTARMARFFIERYKNEIPAHFWIGMSAATRSWFDKNIIHLLGINGTLFISFEPLIEDMKFEDKFDLLGIDQAIIGGESGPRKRPFDPDWARSLRDLCKENGTAFFMKQWDKVQAIPDDLMIREYPK